MKMRRLVVIALVISMLLAIPVAANAASPAPGGPFATSFRVQNLDAQTLLVCTCSTKLMVRRPSLAPALP